MEVIILAGGLGTRLRSEVKDVPKCMAPVAGKPFLAYLLQYLRRFPVTRVILSVGYLREIIFKWISQHQAEYPFIFDYAIEETPLGTGGGIKLALSRATDKDVVVLNGDTFFDVDLNLLLKVHQESENQLSLALKPMQRFDRYGEVVTEKNVIKAFKEKQPCAAGSINGGIYVIRKDNNLMIGLPDKFSFEKDVMEKIVGHTDFCGYDFGGYFLDIGIPEDYHKADREFPHLFE